MYRYESAFARLVAEATDLSEDEAKGLIRIPEPDKGDLSIPCFPLAKRFRKNPAQIAGEIAEAIGRDPRFSTIAAAGPYLNATVDPAQIVTSIIPEVRELKARFCRSEIGAGKNVVIDYSSPNIAKPLGFHHLRSTMIGNALARIHEALGYKVVGINFLGDWGKTFGLLAEAFNRWGDTERLNEEKISYLLELYIRANKAVKEDPSFNESARAMFRKQEAGDEHALSLWTAFREHSIAEFEKVYRRLGVHGRFLFEGESTYRDGMDRVIEKVHEKAGTREDQGALIVDMEYAEGEPPMMLRKSDGATLYATRDIAAAIHRFERFDFAKSLYVVGVEQKRHFDQLKRALTAMGFDWAERMTHVQFGRVQGMSTREGKVVFLDKVLDEAKARALEKMRETAGERDIDIETVAELVGVGGIVFGDLKNLRTSDYSFDWEEILNPKGFTGVCVQYAHARCCSVLGKGGGAPDTAEADLSLLNATEEVALVKDLSRLPAAVQAAADNLEPSRLARAVYEVARSWNRYQQAGNADRSLRILCRDEPTRKARLALVDAVRTGISNVLEMLGVPHPDAM
ncbi:MAG: arginine--tRNA ligase [Deltaproteobacteria bacterium]|nr:arginine--tRNA ligase [Deltaproteobacteria bacterium]